MPESLSPSSPLSTAGRALCSVPNFPEPRSIICHSERVSMCLSSRRRGICSSHFARLSPIARRFAPFAQLRHSLRRKSLRASLNRHRRRRPSLVHIDPRAFAQQQLRLVSARLQPCHNMDYPECASFSRTLCARCISLLHHPLRRKFLRSDLNRQRRGRLVAILERKSVIAHQYKKLRV